MMWKADLITHHMPSKVPFRSLQVLLFAIQWQVRAPVKLLEEALSRPCNFTPLHSLTGPVGQLFASRLGLHPGEAPTLPMKLGSPVSDVSLQQQYSSACTLPLRRLRDLECKATCRLHTKSPKGKNVCWATGITFFSSFYGNDMLSILLVSRNIIRFYPSFFHNSFFKSLRCVKNVFILMKHRHTSCTPTILQITPMFGVLKVLSDDNQGGSKVVSIASSFFTV
jgi:hypothetical protein